MFSSLCQCKADARNETSAASFHSGPESLESHPHPSCMLQSTELGAQCASNAEHSHLSELFPLSLLIKNDWYLGGSNEISIFIK